MTRRCTQESAGILLVVIFFAIWWLKFSISDFLILLKKLWACWIWLSKWPVLPIIEVAESKLTENCLNSWSVCGGAGKLWLLPWWSHLAGVKFLSCQSALLVSMAALSQHERTLGCVRRTAEAPRTASWMCVCCNAVPECLDPVCDFGRTSPPKCIAYSWSWASLLLLGFWISLTAC